ncbi:MAG: hypothetical protein K8T91_24810 [Planctomycetes bacterium]|nr:hypothetical protein [Planctomycetota bacterium]
MNTRHSLRFIPLSGIHVISWLLVTMSWQVVTAAAADDEPKPAAAKPARPEVVELTIHPAAEAEPKLNYRLLPPNWERRPGNAAPLYYRAWLMQQRGPRNDWPVKEVDAWEKMPPEKLPVKEVEKFIQSSVGLHPDMFRMAARREYCRWDLAERDVEDPFNVVFPEVDKAQATVRVLGLMAKLQIAKGDFQEALDTLQISFQMMQDIGQGRFLGHKIYAGAKAETFTRVLEQLVATKGAPNLYWAVRDFPTPFVDLRGAWQNERGTVLMSIPELRDVRTAQLTAEQWQQRWESAVAHSRYYTRINELGSIPPPPEKNADSKSGELLVRLYPTARAGLLNFGYDKAKVEAMAKPQVVLVYEGETLERACDEMESLLLLPHGEALRRRSRLQTPAKDSLIYPLLNSMVNDWGSIARSSLKLPRRLAGVCHIEAIRMYAAAHEGKLPAQLADIKEVPLPLNPFTGKPFEYRLEGDVAVLTATGADGVPELVYRLKLAR